MRRVREMLKLRLDVGLSLQEVAFRSGIARSTLRAMVSRFENSGLPWPLPLDLSDAELEARLYGNAGSKRGHRGKPEPDWARIYHEIKGNKHVTLETLWSEYTEAHPDGYWIDGHENLIISGPTGVGKSWLSCALAHKACRDNRSVLYVRAPKLFDELALAHGDGTFARRSKNLGTVQLLIMDDWGLEPLTAQGRHDLLEILEDRYGRRSTVVTSQVPVAEWHGLIGHATYADAILDRLVHNAHRIELSGDSLRRPKPRPKA
jgi:DNA replication protein DnaC